MIADAYKKKIVLIIIASTFFVLICGVCLFLLGCGNETNSDCEPCALDEFFYVHYQAYDGGYIYGEAEQIVKYNQDTSNVKAKPNEGYEFVGWSDGVMVAARQESNVKADVSVRAIFRKKRYSVIYTTDGNGVLQGIAEQKIEYGNSATTVTAKPNEGYEFVKWSDGVTTATRLDSEVYADLRIKAEFKKKTYYQLKYLVDHNECGTIMGDAIQYVAQGESGSMVKAVPNEGYEFAYWATSADDEQRLTAERTDNNITQDTTLVAYFWRKKVTVKYNATTGGYIYYIKNNNTTIDYGGQSSVVRAEPNRNSDYVFLYWSDGLKTAERTEYNVTSDMNLIAYFGYRAEYKVSNGVGGKIIGGAYQEVLPNADFSAVEAIPDEGYTFGGWSDLQTESIRKDTNAERCIEHLAYFEPIIRTFNYDYGIATGIPMESTVIINRENIILDGYPTPKMSGYTFDGWYADSEYKLKAINSDGRYMLGYYGFSLETDTLYARWKPIDDNGRVFKILLVFVNEVKAKLYSSYNNGTEPLYDVHHLMTTIDREYCALLHDYAINYLCEWLSDLTNIEIDTYFTVYPLNEENIRTFSDCYSLIEESIFETRPLYTSYNSVLSVFGLNNYDGVLANRNVAGSAHRKFGVIHLENFYYAESFVNNRRIQELLIDITINKMREKEFISTFIHEFIHTCELMYRSKEIVEFHLALEATKCNELDAYRLYLWGQLEYDGQLCGIPKDFWINKYDEMLSITGLHLVEF